MSRSDHSHGATPSSLSLNSLELAAHTHSSQKLEKVSILFISELTVRLSAVIAKEREEGGRELQEEYSRAERYQPSKAGRKSRWTPPAGHLQNGSYSLRHLLGAF